MNPKFRTTADLNVRSGPGVTYAVIRSLPTGSVVEEISISDWCPIASPDGTGTWVSRKYLVPYEEVSPVPGQVTGEMLLQAADAMVGKQKYVYGADSPLKQGDNYTGDTDCADFCTERVQEVTGKIYGALRPGSTNPEPWTGQWLADMKAGIVTEIPLEQAKKTPGALLLRFDSQFQHIAFSDGERGTVEAKGAAYGVCRSTADGRGFQYGILIPQVIYKEG